MSTIKNVLIGLTLVAATSTFAVAQADADTRADSVAINGEELEGQRLPTWVCVALMRGRTCYA